MHAHIRRLLLWTGSLYVVVLVAIQFGSGGADDEGAAGWFYGVPLLISTMPREC